MPIILIIVGIIAVLGFGSFLFISKSDDTAVPEVTPIEVVTDSSAPNTSNTAEGTDSTPGTPPATKPKTITPKPVTTTPAPKPVAPVAVSPQTTYKDGTYTVTTSYVAPSRTTHEVTTTFTIVKDIVTETQVNFSGEKVLTSTQYQNKFSQNYQSEVVGKKLDSISLTRVGGASLTTGAFNKALVQVKAQAR